MKLDEIRPVDAELFHADGRKDGQTDRHVEANSRLSQLCESMQKRTDLLCWESQVMLPRLSLTLNIPSLGRQRCLPSWGPRRTQWFLCNFSTL